MLQTSTLKVFLLFFLLLVLPGRGWCQTLQSWADAVGATTQESDVTVLAGQVVEIEGVALAKTVTVSEGGVLRFSPSSSGHLRVVGNVVVQGRLEAQPTNDGISHRLTFEKVNEAAFVGGGMMVLDTDVGLWVMGKGQLDLRGSRKTPHARLAGAVKAGSTAIALEEAPEGWRAGDRIVITPMVPPTYPSHWEAYDESNLASVSGPTIALSTTLKHDHLELKGEHPPQGWTGRTSWTARALNLTRNVIIEGTAAGHAHTFIHSSKLQIVEDVELRNLGPSRLTGLPDATDIKGRYPLHFHHSKKSDVFPTQFHRVTRVAVHNSRGHAFVPHETSGVRFEGCVSHNVQFDAFWWDPHEPSTDIEYINCVASKTVGPVSYRPHRMAGFNLAQGERMTARGNLAVGTQGGSNTSGYIWGEGLAGRWDFDNNESFCNKVNGIFTWQNSPLLHDINDVVCGWNGTNGLDHGAYQTMYQYRRMWLIGNRHAGMKLHASSGHARAQTFSEFSVEGQGITAWAMTVNHPSLRPAQRTMLENWKVRGVTAGLMQVTEGGGGEAHHMLLNNWDHDVQDQNKWFHLHSNVRTLDWFEIRNFTGQTESFDLRRVDFPEGTYVAAWNAKKVIIGGTPTPTPDPTPDPEPTPEPTPDPEPTPEPMPEPTPTPTKPGNGKGNGKKVGHTKTKESSVVGMENENDKPAVLIYPVPSNTNFTLFLGGNENETAEIAVYDLLGRKVEEFKGVAGQAIQFGDKLKTGTYLVHTWLGGQRTILKVLKQ